ncbi:ATP-binding protein [Sulfurivermis fontis]|uniref:ATP-binding protein n=1 Tax=Sulfurivermis fontis TaxID=1972068 RepID=UPI000FDC7F12|nr:ATP-binding protein [Sulfurivermis fontis]
MDDERIDWQRTWAALWRHHRQALRAARHLDPIRLEQLLGIERQKQALVHNTERFLAGLPANNALLWGARGTGKSSLIKALLNAYAPRGLRLIEVDKDDLLYLPEIVDDIRELPQRFIVFCDDLSFEAGERSYKALKSVLEGSIELPPDNVLVYATSNRRHLMPESMQDNLASGLVEGELHYADAIEEKISLSDRFGLWLSFYPATQDEYLAMVDSYFTDYRGDRSELHHAALQFAQSKGGTRSGRTARQFFNAWGERPATS